MTFWAIFFLCAAMAAAVFVIAFAAGYAYSESEHRRKMKRVTNFVKSLREFIESDDARVGSPNQER